MTDVQALKKLHDELLVSYRDDRGFWIDLDAFTAEVKQIAPSIHLCDYVFVVCSAGQYHLMVGEYKKEDMEIFRVEYESLQVFMANLFSFFSARMGINQKMPYKIA